MSVVLIKKKKKRSPFILTEKNDLQFQSIFARREDFRSGIACLVVYRLLLFRLFKNDEQDPCLFFSDSLRLTHFIWFFLFFFR